MMKWLFLFGFIALISSCYYDSKSELYPKSAACDTVNIKFSTGIMPLINKDCISCHGGSSPLGVIPLNNYAEVKACYTSGKLMGSLNWSSGYKAMPQGGSKWSSCNLNKIQSWINNGLQNN